MVEDDKSGRFVRNFVGQWLQTRDVEAVPIDERTFPALRISTREAMARETEALFADVVRRDLDLTTLLTARYTFVDEELAKFYGMKGVEGRDMRRVELPDDDPRGGILTHGSFLVATSNPTRTSPVKRGVFVLNNLLGTPPPPQPPDVPQLEAAGANGGPKGVRALLEAHRGSLACASCHKRMDPIGLGLESFDAIGRWRGEEEGRPLDTAGELPSGERFAGVKELREILARRRELFYRTFVSKLMIYVLGRGLEPADRCTIDGTVDRMLAEGGRFFVALAGVVGSAAFQSRRGDGAHVVASGGP